MKNGFRIPGQMDYCNKVSNRIFAVFFGVSLFFGLFLSSCNREDLYIQLPGTQGPITESKPVVEEATRWETYSRGEPSRLAVYLHNDDSPWLGIVHGLKAIGVPFLITDSLEKALEHTVVLTYPRLRERDLEDGQAVMLQGFVRDGGVLLGTLIDAKSLYGLFGFDDLDIGRTRYEITYAESEYDQDFIYPRERTIRIGNPERPKTFLRTIAYLHPREVLAEYNDGSAAIVRRRTGEGEAIAFGLDLGFYIKKAQNNRDEEAGRAYVNEFEPSVDTILRYIKNIYRMNEPLAATLHTVPDGYPLSVIISHDVDYSGSLANSITYAEYQRSMDYGATYFMQTKYFEDFFDEVFFDDQTTDLLTELEEMDMELGSHSVSHTDMFARVPRGNYRETYPDYQPRIIEFFYTRDATVTGEIRVSKFLIEELSDSTVVSFRPGFLANPSSLPQALQATGYRYSSTVTANDVLTHLPFRQTFGRGYDMEVSIYEFPITVEDEKPPEMDKRVDEAVELARKISRYGGLYVVLIHPNVLDHKYRFLVELTSRLRDWCWWGTLQEFGAWWTARDGVEFDITPVDDVPVLAVRAVVPVERLGILLPDGFLPADGDVGMVKNGLLVTDVRAGLTEIKLIAID